MACADALVRAQIIKAYGLKGLYTPGVPLLHRMLYVFDRLVEIRLPKLFSHFKGESVTPDLFSSLWFTGLFAVSLRPPLVARVWDLLFCDGIVHLYRVALAILQLLQDQLLEMRFEELLNCLKNSSRSVQAGELIAAAEKFALTAQDLRLYESEYAARIAKEQAHDEGDRVI